MNNIEIIKDFIKDSTKSKLLVNQVNEEIGSFYVNFFKNEASVKNIKLKFTDNEFSEPVSDLFDSDKINLCFPKNKNNLEKNLNSDSKCVIFTDYKNYRTYNKSISSVNGYNYIKDIEYYISKILRINNSEIINFCVASPYLAFSEISKYLINSSGYLKESKIKEINNFILEIRKELFNLKKNQGSAHDLYINLKKEVRYKKFSFLVF